MLSDREYRYFSPVVLYDEKTLEVMELQSIALTNRPAMKGITPLMLEDVDSGETKPKPPEQPRMKALLKQLGLDENATEGEAISRFASLQLEQSKLLSMTGVKDMPEAVAVVATWKAAADALPGHQKRVAELEQATSTAKKQALLEQGKKEGKVTPALESMLLELLG